MTINNTATLPKTTPFTVPYMPWAVIAPTIAPTTIAAEVTSDIQHSGSLIQQGALCGIEEFIKDGDYSEAGDSFNYVNSDGVENKISMLSDLISKIATQDIDGVSMFLSAIKLNRIDKEIAVIKAARELDLRSLHNTAEELTALIKKERS